MRDEGKTGLRRKLGLLLLALILALPYLAYATASIEETAEASNIGIAEDWRALAIGAIMLSILLVAIGYMLGHAFEMPEIKAWAQNEMVQVFVSAIIVVAFTFTALLLDAYLETIVQNSNLGFSCSGSTNCAVTVSEQYLAGITESAEKQARDNVVEAASAAKWAYTRFGLSTPMLIPLLQASTSFTFTAGRLMDVERRNTVLEYLGNMLSSLYAQEFFVKEISFKLAPIILVIGIIARSFFFTRKMGGLLIAVGIGVMYVFPLMYVFDWLTLNITMFGASSIEPNLQPCPAACMIPPPRFYNDGGTQFFSRTDLIDYLESQGQSEESVTSGVAALDSGSASSRTFGSVTIYGCQATDCPLSCRDLPYPLVPECNVPEAISACAALDSRCKMIRYVNPGGGNSDIYNDGSMANGECPEKCRSVPPLKGDCSAGGCVSGSDFCKFARRPEMERPAGCSGDAALNCPANLDATQSCVWVLPSKEDVDAHECDACNFVPQQYTYGPPIYLSCADLCNPSPTGPPKISPGEFSRRSQEGMVGKEEIKAVSALMLPAYVLPILNIVVTLIFIRSFSQIIGGDIEIPGLTRIL
ncbi:MAG: hypothetical protein AB1529_04380 [Candidatus Micrarchaeota archaeon]